MATRTESWKGIGVVRVTRDPRGRFTRWTKQAPTRKAQRLSDAERVRRVSLRAAQKEAKTREYTRKVAKGVKAKAKAKAERKPPAKKGTRIGPRETAIAVYGHVRFRGKTRSGRYEFIGGTGKDLYHARRIANNRPPRGFVTVRTSDFLANPLKYSVNGVWDGRVETDSK